VPYGWDLTDNKTLIAGVAWLWAWWRTRGGRADRLSVVAAAVVTLGVFCDPAQHVGITDRLGDEALTAPVARGGLLHGLHRTALKRAVPWARPFSAGPIRPGRRAGARPGIRERLVEERAGPTLSQPGDGLPPRPAQIDEREACQQGRPVVPHRAVRQHRLPSRTRLAAIPARAWSLSRSGSPSSTMGK